MDRVEFETLSCECPVNFTRREDMIKKTVLFVKKIIVFHLRLMDVSNIIHNEFTHHMKREISGVEGGD